LDHDPLDHDDPWITITLGLSDLNPLILSVALQSGCRGPALAVGSTGQCQRLTVEHDKPDSGHSRSGCGGSKLMQRA
jgi:hypothetical protein